LDAINRLTALEKMHHGFHKNIKQQNLIKIGVLIDFWRIMWHWRLERWCWKCSFAITGI